MQRLWRVVAQAGEVRRFRVDRLVALERTGERFDPAVEPPPAAAYQPGPDGRRVVLDLPASAHWVAEAYPVECEEREDRLSLAGREGFGISLSRGYAFPS